MRLADLVSWLDETLNADSFSDYGPIGLQVVGADEVTHLATAVSVSLEVIERAIADGAQALLVHHGLFWQGDDPVIGTLERRRLQTLFAGDLSLIAYHLPLDAHPTLGNNACLAELLGLHDRAPFGEHGGSFLGVQGALPAPTPVAEVASALGAQLGSTPLVLSGGDHPVRTLGIVSGGAAKAASGQMTMMTSGTAAAYALCEPMLNAMAASVYKLGDKAGAGSKVKIINQLLAGVHIAAAAEAMALGLREGVDAAALYEVITHSAGNSWMFENRMAHVLAADYTPLSAVDIFVKDLGLVLDMARASKFPLPLSSTAHQMFMQASTAGFAKEDDSAVIKIFPGIVLPKAG